MTTGVLATLAALVSIAALARLAHGDPKRLRTATKLGASSGSALSITARRGLAALVLAPGVVLALLGAWPAFLIWMGVATGCGWALAQLLAPRPKATTS